MEHEDLYVQLRNRNNEKQMMKEDVIKKYILCVCAKQLWLSSLFKWVNVSGPDKITELKHILAENMWLLEEYVPLHTKYCKQVLLEYTLHVFYLETVTCIINWRVPKEFILPQNAKAGRRILTGGTMKFWTPPPPKNTRGEQQFVARDDCASS